MGSSAGIRTIRNMGDLLERLSRPLGETGQEEVVDFIGILASPKQAGNCIDILMRHCPKVVVINRALDRFSVLHNTNRHDAWVNALFFAAEALWQDGIWATPNDDGMPSWLQRLYQQAFSRECQFKRSQVGLINLYRRYAPVTLSSADFGLTPANLQKLGLPEEVVQSFSVAN